MRHRYRRSPLPASLLLSRTGRGTLKERCGKNGDGLAPEPDEPAQKRVRPRPYRLAVDVELSLVAAGGEYHKDCEDALLAVRSQQDHVWGATWIRTTKAVEFVSVINIGPRSGTWTMELQDELLRARIERAVRKYMEAI